MRESESSQLTRGPYHNRSPTGHKQPRHSDGPGVTARNIFVENLIRTRARCAATSLDWTRGFLLVSIAISLTGDVALGAASLVTPDRGQERLRA